MGPFRLISIDLEASDLDPVEGALVSIAAVDYETRETFYEEIDYYLEDGQLFCPARLKNFRADPESMNIHKLDYSGKMFGKRRNIVEVEAELHNWLSRRGGVIIPLGLNVAGFDLQYIQRHMNSVSQALGYRSVDLTALTYFLYTVAEDSTSGKEGAFNSTTTYGDFSEVIFSQAKQKTQVKYPDLDEHNALFDAMFNCHVYDILFLNSREFLVS